MPIIQRSAYPGPPLYQFNAHLQTIVPSVFRKVDPPPYERERLELPDGDFLDIDWLVQQKTPKLVIIGHGLEGSSDRTYVRGMAQYLFRHGWDVLAWNCRACSGEMNRQPRLYHHGEIGDIEQVIRHALQRKPYEQLSLVGFSMGGSIVLKYLGVHERSDLPVQLNAAVAISAPCDLEAGVDKLEHPGNRFYRQRFLQRLKVKLAQKAEQFPELIDLANLERVEHWRDFDAFFSAPINGFTSAAEFYQAASAKNFVAGVRIPTLLVNAQNDPLLTPSCNPVEVAEQNPHFFLERPKRGGHTGFALPGKTHTWAEFRTLQFLTEHLFN